MNTTDPGNSGPTRPTRGFFDSIRDTHIVRSESSWLGGVAGGLAQRMGIDPILVRGFIVVLSIFTGVGPFLYGLAWAFLPDRNGYIHAEALRYSRWAAGMTGAVIFGGIGLLNIQVGSFSPWDWGRNSWLTSLIVLALIIGATVFFITRQTGGSGSNGGGTPSAPDSENRPYPDGGSPAGNPTGTAPGYPAPFVAPAAGPATAPAPFGAPAPATAPQSVDELHGNAGAAAPEPAAEFSGPAEPAQSAQPAQTAQSAQSAQPAPQSVRNPQGARTPHPPHVPHAARPPRPRVLGPGAATGLLCTGLAFLAGAAVLGVSTIAGYGFNGSAVAIALGVAAAVFALGVLISGIRGRHGGFLGWMAVFALIGGLFTSFGGQSLNWAAATSATFIPGTAAEAGDGYAIAAASGTIDLSRIRDLDGSGPITVPVNVAMSDLRVYVPNDVRVSVDTSLALAASKITGGSVDNKRGGLWFDNSAGFGPNSENGPQIILEIRGAFSNVTVTDKPRVAGESAAAPAISKGAH
ncbi:phage shock protein PspC (stress-responsive transcriptional regulator) [Mycetocola sp. BIGb0189]|uniref:PspC domain-containing protein n=1 Tax=Mycetocola sp. BIGb0189 TaxID=2940604 RepID=UPI002168DAAF|nr:PspC domain-containing protein [Mycetocola sp. BIGb0189]MCS4274976.1 phage shock protein PspC (stress-responsive transcriptional regulator) [Mycetocola sp. BIGb0189]